MLRPTWASVEVDLNAPLQEPTHMSSARNYEKTTKAFQEPMTVTDSGQDCTTGKSLEICLRHRVEGIISSFRKRIAKAINETICGMVLYRQHFRNCPCHM